MLSSHLCHGFQNGLYPSGFPVKILYLFLFLPMRATCRARRCSTQAVVSSVHVGFVVDKVALGRVSSECFVFPYQFSFHQLLHVH
jgi:hypothetical protein